MICIKKSAKNNTERNNPFSSQQILYYNFFRIFKIWEVMVGKEMQTYLKKDESCIALVKNIQQGHPEDTETKRIELKASLLLENVQDPQNQLLRCDWLDECNIQT